MTRYIHWPLDITAAALAEVAGAVAARQSFMADDNYRMERANGGRHYPPQLLVELQNIANEARAMLQKLPPKPIINPMLE